MNRTELVRAVAERAGSDESAARRHVDAVVETVMERVTAGERVIITGFGTFDRLSRPARSARNPRTGLAVQVPAAEVPRFRIGQTFRNRVAQSTPVAGAQPVAAAAAPDTAVSVVVEPSAPKVSGNSKVASGSKDVKHAKNGKNPKDAKNSKPPKGTKDARGPEGPKSGKTAKEPKDVKVARDTKGVKSPKGAKGVKGSKEVNSIKGGKEAAKASKKSKVEKQSGKVKARQGR